jgi:hypothetical protein
MYLPPPVTTQVTFGGRFTSDFCDRMRDAAKDGFTALASTPVVYSKVLHEAAPVVSLRVGDVPDSQRRRRRGQIETYHTVAL